MRLDTIYRQTENIVTRKVLGETLLVPIAGNLASMDEMFSLNDIGTFIWNAIDGVRSLEGILQQIERRYDAPPSIIEADLIAQRF